MGGHVDFAHVEAGEDAEAGWWRSCCLAVLPVGDIRCSLHFYRRGRHATQRSGRAACVDNRISKRAKKETHQGVSSPGLTPQLAPPLSFKNLGYLSCTLAS